jgi:hypothetical protein
MDNLMILLMKFRADYPKMGTLAFEKTAEAQRSLSHFSFFFQAAGHKIRKIF